MYGNFKNVIISSNAVANVQAETGVVFYASFRPSQDKGVADLWLKRKPPWVDSSKNSKTLLMFFLGQ